MRLCVALFAAASCLLTGCGCQVEIGDTGSDEEATTEVAGKGFSTQLQGEWKDLTLSAAAEFQLQTAAKTDDRIAVDAVRQGEGDDIGVALIFGRLLAPPYDGDLLGAAQAQIEQTQSLGLIPEYRVVKAPEPGETAGAANVAFEYTGRPDGPVHVRVVLSAHAGKVYLVSVTTPPADFERGARRLEEALEEWSWRPVPEPSAAKAAYITAMDEICLQFEGRLRPLEAEINELGEGGELDRIPELGRQAVRVFRTEVQRLRAVPPPRDESARNAETRRRLLELMSEQLQLTTAQFAAIRSRDEQEFERLGQRSDEVQDEALELSRRYGFEACGLV